jgi:hypothetical protein
VVNWVYRLPRVKHRVPFSFFILKNGGERERERKNVLLRERRIRRRKSKNNFPSLSRPQKCKLNGKRVRIYWRKRGSKKGGKKIKTKTSSDREKYIFCFLKKRKTRTYRKRNSRPSLNPQQSRAKRNAGNDVVYDPCGWQLVAVNICNWLGRFCAYKIQIFKRSLTFFFPLQGEKNYPLSLTHTHTTPGYLCFLSPYWGGTTTPSNRI